MPVPRHKMAVLNWAAIYPLITAILWLAGPALNRLPLYVATLVISLALTAAMNFAVMPLMISVFSGWLQPAAGRGRGARSGGA